MSQYRVIREKDLLLFNRTICELLDNGWSCVGGIYFANGNYMQAMLYQSVD